MYVSKCKHIVTWYEDCYFGMHNTVTYEGDGQVCVTGNSRTIGHASLDHVFCGSSLLI